MWTSCFNNSFQEEDDVEELDDEDDGSQVDSQDEDAGSQAESQDSQDERVRPLRVKTPPSTVFTSFQSQEEQESPRAGDNKARRRRARKAD